MIIIMLNNEQNRLAAQVLRQKDEAICAYHQISFKNNSANKDGRLALIDLSTDGETLLMLNGEAFVNDLIQKGIPDNIKTIDLIIAGPTQILADNQLYGIRTLATAIAEQFYTKAKREVTVRILAGIDHQLLALTPPESSEVKDHKKNWVLHDKASKKSPPTLVWEGAYLEEWLSQPAHQIKAMAVTAKQNLSTFQTPNKTGSNTKYSSDLSPGTQALLDECDAQLAAKSTIAPTHT